MKSTYLIALLYSLLFARVSGRFEAFSESELVIIWTLAKQMRSWQNLLGGPGELTGLFVDCRRLQAAGYPRPA